MKYKLVYVEWEDAFSDNAEWRSLEGAIVWAEHSATVITVGFLIEENKRYLLLSNQVSGELYAGLTKIPITWIRKRKILKL